MSKLTVKLFHSMSTREKNIIQQTIKFLFLTVKKKLFTWQNRKNISDISNYIKAGQFYSRKTRTSSTVSKMQIVWTIYSSDRNYPNWKNSQLDVYSDKKLLSLESDEKKKTNHLFKQEWRTEKFEYCKKSEMGLQFNTLIK